MLSIALLCLLFIFLQASFSFCSKKKCPAFSDKEFNAWFPYTQNETVYYKTINNDEDSINNFSVYKSSAAASSSGFNAPQCEISASVQGFPADSLGPYFKINYIISGTANVNNSLQLNLNQFLVFGISINDSGIVIDRTMSQLQTSYFPGIVLDGKNFLNVQSIQMDTASLAAAGIYKIWIAKNNGLIGYEEYPSLIRWIKQ